MGCLREIQVALLKLNWRNEAVAGLAVQFCRNFYVALRSAQCLF